MIDNIIPVEKNDTTLTKYDSTFISLHCHSQFSFLDGVATVQQYAEECQKRGISAHALTEHGHMGSVAEGSSQFKKHGVQYIPGCFVGSQLVRVSDGFIPICDVSPGDLAYTHNGRYRRVLNTQCRAYSGDILTIKINGAIDQTVTPDHPFLVKVGYAKPRFILASEIFRWFSMPGDRLEIAFCMPKPSEPVIGATVHDKDIESYGYGNWFTKAEAASLQFSLLVDNKTSKLIAEDDGSYVLLKTNPLQDDEYVYYDLLSVTSKHTDINVYNFEVEEDNSYFTGVAVHNCEIYYNDYEPDRQRLEAAGISVRSKKFREENVELSYRINRNRHLTVLCKNQEGYHNLLKLTTEAFEDGLFGMGTTQYNRVWFDKLAKYKDGLIVLSGCLNGPVAHELRYKEVKNKAGEVIAVKSRSERLQKADEYVRLFKTVFGENYVIETQMPGIEDDHEIFADLHQLAYDHKLKIVLANDSHYIERQDHIIQLVMMAVSQGVTIHSPDLFHVNSSEQYLKTRTELRDYFLANEYSKLVPLSDFEGSCDMTLEIASRCTPVKLNSDLKIPRFDQDSYKLAELTTRELVKKGLHTVTKKYVIDGKSVTYIDQLAIELDRIAHKGFSSYFLVLHDIVSYGRSNNALFGPRGCSVPGSLITKGDGAKEKIENIEIGDVVLDGFGDERIVQNKFVYEVFEDILNIEFAGGSVSITADHKLYVVRDGDVVLVKADKLDMDDLLIDVETVNIKLNDTGFINNQHIIIQQEMNIERLQNVIEHLNKMKINNIYRTKHNGKVYDIQVSGTNSYQLNGVFSSNSAGGCLICYLLGLSSIDSLKWGLSFDRFLSPSRGGFMLNLDMGKVVE